LRKKKDKTLNKIVHRISKQKSGTNQPQTLKKCTRTHVLDID